MRLTYLLLGCVLATCLALVGCGEQAPFTPEESAAIQADVGNELSTEGYSSYDYIAHLEADGRLALVLHSHELMLKVVATLAELWQRQGGAAPGAARSAAQTPYGRPAGRRRSARRPARCGTE